MFVNVLLVGIGVVVPIAALATIPLAARASKDSANAAKAAMLRDLARTVDAPARTKPSARSDVFIPLRLEEAHGASYTSLRETMGTLRIELAKPSTEETNLERHFNPAKVN